MQEADKNVSCRHEEFKDTMKTTRKKLEMHLESAKPGKVDGKPHARIIPSLAEKEFNSLVHQNLSRGEWDLQCVVNREANDSQTIHGTALSNLKKKTTYASSMGAHAPTRKRVKEPGIQVVNASPRSMWSS